MIESIKKDWRVQVLIVMFVLLTIWWKLSPEIVGSSYYTFRFQFASIYFTIPLFGAICGIFASRNLAEPVFIRRARIYFSIGLLCQVWGQISYCYLTIQHIDVPYGSIGDLGYFGTIPFYLLGIIYLAKAAGVQLWLESFENKFQAAVISAVTLVIAYGLFLSGYVFDWSHPIKIFLDFAYPIGDTMYFSIGVLTYLATQSVKNKVVQSVVFAAVCALFLQFLADYMFSWQVSNNLVAFGGPNDYLCMVAYVVMVFTVFRLDSLSQKSR